VIVTNKQKCFSALKKHLNTPSMLLKQAISSRVLLMMMMANTSTETSCGVEL